jgi:tetratricopeptide (TPR) repeat protein
MDLRHRLLAAVLAVGLTTAPFTATAQAVTEQATPSPRVQINVQQEASPASETPHLEAYNLALTAAQTGGFAALQEHVPALAEALSHAPSTYPVMQEVDGGWLIRANSRDEIMALAQRIGEIEQARGGGDIKIVSRPNVYPSLAFLLGSAAVERRDFAAAHTALDQGLALQPLNRLLLNEKLVVLHAERRWEDAHLLVKTALTANDPLIEARPANLQRRLGYTLVELGRLHEARAAYEASLIAEPGNATALAELEFIAGATAGQPDYGDVRITAPYMPAPGEAAPPAKTRP